MSIVVSQQTWHSTRRVALELLDRCAEWNNSAQCVVDGGVLSTLVPLLDAKPESIEGAETSSTRSMPECAIRLLATLCTVAEESDDDLQERLIEEFARTNCVPKIVALLSSSTPIIWESAIDVLCHLAHFPSPDRILCAIHAAGGIPALVAMASNTLYGRQHVCMAATLASLFEDSPTRSMAAFEAGAMPPLVALISSYTTMIAADADEALAAMIRSCNSDRVDVATIAAMKAEVQLRGSPNGAGLKGVLRANMVRRLASADAREDTAALSSALAHADDLDMGGCTEEGAGRSLEYWQKVQRARARLVELETEAALQARRESLGLGHVKPPDDFVCPITCSTMEDPVVASDGHSYERSAMQDFLQRGNGRSPLTRVPLDPGVLIPNHNLKRRIREHGEEMLQMCEAAVAAMAGAAPPTSHKRARVAEAPSAGAAMRLAAGAARFLVQQMLYRLS